MVIRTKEYIVVAKVNGLPNVVPVKRVSLARTANEDGLRFGATTDVTDDDTQQEATPVIGYECEYTQYSCSSETETRR